MKTAPAQAEADTDVTYVVTVRNFGPGTANAITLTDPIPNGMTFVSAASDDPAFLCTTPAAGDPGTITCSGTTLAANDEVVFTFVVHISPDAQPATTFTNVATVSSANDNNSANNSDFVETLVPTPNSDLSVTKSGPATATAGSNVTYQISVTNLGPDVAEGVTLQDMTPGTMTFVSVTADPAFSCSAPAPGSSGTVECFAGNFAAGATANFTVVFHIPAQEEAGTQFTNIATVSTESDLTTDNNTAAAVTTIPAPPTGDLAVTKSGPRAAAPDTDVTFTITLTNGGPGDAMNTTLTDTLPGDSTFVSLSQSGTLLSCATPAIGSGGTVTCTSTTYPAGSATTLTLTLHIPSGTFPGTQYANVARASADNDPNDENNDASATVTVATSDLNVVKTGPPVVAAGSNATYTITVTNQGPDIASEVVMTDVLPPNTTFVSVTPNAGSPPTTCQLVSNTVLCGTSTLAPAQSMSVTLVLTAGNTTSISNTASATSESFDPDSSDNQSTAVTAVTQLADLAVTKSAISITTAGTQISFTVNVSNAGPTSAQNVTVTDVLPANTTFVSMNQNSGPAFSCAHVAGTVTCSIATFAPGETASFAIIAMVSSAATGTITNTATINSAVTPDPVPGNNTSNTTSTTLLVAADLAIAKNAPATVVSGQQLTFVVTAINNGPSDATSVTLTDTLPANTTFVSSSQTGGPTFACNHAAGTITCTTPTFGAGVSATLNFVVTVNSEGLLANTASIQSPTFDPVLTNNQSTSNTNASRAPADLSITKTANAPTPVPGAPATYTIVVANAGPGPAADVVVTDVLPPGVTLVSATTTQGSCSGTTTVVCTLGTLNASTSATITLDIRLPLTPGPVVNTATVTSSDADPNIVNNSGTATINSGTVAGIPTLSEWMLLLLAVGIAAVAMKLLKS